MKRTKMKAMLAGLGLCTALAAALSGCGGTEQIAAVSAGSTAPVASVAGSILMSVNPEIEIDYDKSGHVLEVEGVNEDGKRVVSDYTGFEGRPTDEVMAELVAEIDRDGYFDNGLGGRDKNIVLKVADGSTYPTDNFIERVAESVRASVSDRGGASRAYSIERDDLDDQGYIGIEAAKQLVLGQLGIDPAQATFVEHEYELDDGVYEFEFVSGGVGYDYEVDARTGKVLEADFDRNDDWDDRDLWGDDDWDDADDIYDGLDDRRDDVDDRDDWNEDADDRDDDLDDRDDDWDGNDDDDDDDDGWDD